MAQFTLIAAATIAIFQMAAALPHEHCSELQAMFSYRDTFYIVYGDNELAGFDSEYHEVLHGNVGQDIGYENYVTAALGDDDNNQLFLFSGKTDQRFNEFKDPTETDILGKTGLDKVLELVPGFSSVDAAFRFGPHDAFLISNCTYARVDIDHMFEILDQGHVDHLKLPCEPDAAITINFGKDTFITKGPNVYIFSHPSTEVFDTEVRDFKSFWPRLEFLHLCNYQ